MSDGHDLRLERRLRTAASAFPYPQTPPIQAAVQRRLARAAPRPRPDLWRRAAMVALVLLLMLATLLAVPTVRAAIARLLRVGAMTIFIAETEGDLARPPQTAAPAAPIAEPSALPGARPAATGGARPGAGMAPPPVPDIALATPTVATAAPTPGLQGPMTLLEAQAAVGFPLRLPAAGSDLGAPDEIYIQLLDEANDHWLAILVWNEPPGAARPRLTIYQMNVPDYGLKWVAAENLLPTGVNGEPAYWVEGQHLLQIPLWGGRLHERLSSSVLLWTDGELTYRLEGAPSAEEAVRLAETLSPAPEE